MERARVGMVLIWDTDWVVREWVLNIALERVVEEKIEALERGTQVFEA
jgi:predicted GNAT superfamily acetyltransferase